MDDNQLGKNIQHLREIHGETLDELGAAVGFAKSTIKGYENGSRKPDPETLRKLAAHYGKTVDELMYADLSELEKIQISSDSIPSFIGFYEKMMPIFSSEKCMANKNFSEGYRACKRILSAFEKGENLRGSLVVDVFQNFMQAFEQVEEPEVLADLLWSVFLWWSQIFDVSKGLELQNKLLSKKLDMMELVSAKQNESSEVKEKKVAFIAYFDEIINEAIRALKSEVAWSDLADYYLALRYMVGLIDTDFSIEMNTAIGMQMMMSFAKLDNQYAMNYLKLCTSA